MNRPIPNSPSDLLRLNYPHMNRNKRLKERSKMVQGVARAFIEQGPDINDLIDLGLFVSDTMIAMAEEMKNDEDENTSQKTKLLAFSIMQSGVGIRTWMRVLKRSMTK